MEAADASGQDLCWREQWLDPAGDVPALDVVAHSASYHCEEDVWQHAALTDDDWPTADLGAYFVDISTTGDPGEGCEGFDFLVFGFQEEGELIAGVLDTPGCDSDTWSVAGPAFIGRADATDFVSVVFDFSFSLIGAPTHEDSINQLAAAGVVSGTSATSYAPNRPVRRDQMATFLVSAYRHLTGTELRSEHTYFDDVARSTHRDNINAAAGAGLTSGTGPRQFAPLAAVRRDQMASFLARTLNRLVDDGVATPPAS